MANSKKKLPKNNKPGTPLKNPISNMNPAKFIKIPRSFISGHLPSIEQNSNSIGWVINFKDNNSIVFRNVEAQLIPSNIITVQINTASNKNNTHEIIFVDEFLNDTDNGSISNVFNFNTTDFNDDNWDSYDNKKEVPFLFIDRNQINDMYPDGNYYFLSKESFSFVDSAISVATNQGTSNSEEYDFIKIECVRLNLQAPELSPHAIQAKVIFALPCPPYWNPAFLYKEHKIKLQQHA